jgi:hypothetical protein
MKTRSRARRSNARKLREASRIAMTWPVLVMADVDELVTLSLAPWQTKGKAEAMRRRYQVLGVFRAMAGEGRYAAFSRMWEEAVFSGALLGEMPGEAWVCVDTGTKGRRVHAVA